MKKNNATVRLVRGSLVAAIYAALSYLSIPLTFMFFQFRLSEALCILPIFLPEAAIGIFVGCIIANYLSGCVIWDIAFGSIATLIGALLARAMRRLPDKLIFLATLPTVLANAVIVPFVIMYAYGSPESYWFLFATVAIGELVTATIGGTALYFGLKRNRVFKAKT